MGKYFIKTFDEQTKFIDKVFSAAFNILLMAGSIRSGKTITDIVSYVMLAKAFPKSKWVVVRKDMPTLKRTFIPTFFKYCPSNFVADYNRSDQVVTMTNKSQFIFMEENFSKDPELNRFKGLEANGFILNQIEELRQTTFAICVSRAGQWAIDPMPPHLILADMNPTQNWCKKQFYDKWKSGILPKSTYFQMADILDNPYISQAYLDLLKETMSAEMFARFVENNWDAVDELDQLNSWDDIHACNTHIVSTDKSRSLGVDVGHKGKDPTVFIVLEGPNIIEVLVIPTTKTTQVRDRIIKYMVDYSISADRVCVDSVGVGAGVVDELEEKGFYVIPMVGGAKEIVRDRLVGTNFKFTNWKSWCAWEAREAIRHRVVGGLKEDGLISDAGAIWYFINRDKEIQIEGKDQLKKRIGRSCDYWDAFCYVWWAYKQDELMASHGSIYTTEMLKREEAIERKAEEPRATAGLKKREPVEAADKELERCIAEGYVPDSCTLKGEKAWVLVNAGRCPCDSCEAERSVCGGTVKIETEEATV